MSLFRRKQKDYLGIDFGAGGIKVLQLGPFGNGRGKLFTYGFAERAFEDIGGDYLEDVEKSGDLLKLICKKAKTTTTQGVAALPIPAVFSSVLTIAKVPKKEMRQAVEWEAKKLIPLPLEEVMLDYKELFFDKKVVDKNEGKGNVEEKVKKSALKEDKQGTVQVLLTAAPKGIIDKYVEIAKHAGITLASLETEAFALIRSLIGNDPTSTAIVDMGAARSNILIVDRGIPMLTRSVEIGGKHCTEAISNSLGLDIVKAESIKKDLGNVSLPGTQVGSIPTILAEVLEPLINELRYSFSVYQTRSESGGLPERIILAGGGAGIPGIVEFFSSEFGLRTFAGNPWELVRYNEDLKPVLGSFGSRFAVSVGLALRNL